MLLNGCHKIEFMRMEIDGLTLKIPNSVYKPSEDSLLLSKYGVHLKGKILDVGCGCGIAGLMNAKQNPKNYVLGVDKNPYAVECSRYNAIRNGIGNMSFILSDLFENVPKERFDGILFNPPYLPTEEDERLNDELNYAFDGGPDGRALTERFLDDFERYLADSGIVLIIQSSLSGIEKTVSDLEKRGFIVSLKEEQKFFFEKISLIEGQNRKILACSEIIKFPIQGRKRM